LFEVGVVARVVRRVAVAGALEGADVERLRVLRVHLFEGMAERGGVQFAPAWVLWTGKAVFVLSDSRLESACKNLIALGGWIRPEPWLRGLAQNSHQSMQAALGSDILDKLLGHMSAVHGVLNERQPQRVQ